MDKVLNLRDMYDDELSLHRRQLKYELDGFQTVVNDPDVMQYLKDAAARRVREFRVMIKQTENEMRRRGDDPAPLED